VRKGLRLKISLRATRHLKSIEPTLFSAPSTSSGRSTSLQQDSLRNSIGLRPMASATRFFEYKA